MYLVEERVIVHFQTLEAYIHKLLLRMVAVPFFYRYKKHSYRIYKVIHTVQILPYYPGSEWHQGLHKHKSPFTVSYSSATHEEVKMNVYNYDTQKTYTFGSIFFPVIRNTIKI